MLQTEMFLFRKIRLLTERAGIINATYLPKADAAKVTPETGILAPVIQDFPKSSPEEAGYCPCGYSDHPVTPEG
jgi:hypothetical protein